MKAKIFGKGLIYWLAVIGLVIGMTGTVNAAEGEGNCPVPGPIPPGGTLKCDFNVCDDNIDNDGDGFIDGADPDCSGGAPHACLDGLDNDGDGWIDSADPSCWRVHPPSDIPTLTQWGIIILMTVIMGIGVMILVRRRMA